MTLTQLIIFAIIIALLYISTNVNNFKTKTITQHNFTHSNVNESPKWKLLIHDFVNGSNELM